MGYFEPHMRDKVILERFLEMDNTNTRTFDDPIEIECRLVNKQEVIKLNSEEEVVSNFTLYTTVPIGKYDRVNGYDVLELYEYKSLYDWEVWGYRVRF